MKLLDCLVLIVRSLFITIQEHGTNVSVTKSNLSKKLSYRKQIARKLCIQYVEGIYCNYVTLKSRLEVIQGHRNWFLRLCSCP